VLPESNQIAIGRLANLVELIAKLYRMDKEILLVSSGAVAAGYTQFKLIELR